MLNDSYWQAPANALRIKPVELGEVAIEVTQTRNAAAAMTAFLVQRLRQVDPTLKKLRNTTYAWNGGVINIRNAVKSEVWTNLRLNLAEAFHKQAAERDVLYLLTCWEPHDTVLHAWAVPEDVMYSALPRFPVERDPAKKTVRIKPDSDRFEVIEDSPKIGGYHVVVEFTQPELKKLNEAMKADAAAKAAGLDGAHDGESDSEADDSDDVAVTPPTEASAAMSYWFVGAYDGSDEGDEGDQTQQMVRDGIWRNGWEDRHLDLVRSIRPGERIAIKSTYVRKNDLPFDNRNQIVSVMAIKAIGTVTENPGDGRVVKVKWEPLGEPREWYFYTYQGTIWRVSPGKWQTDALIALTFDGQPQDIARFRNAPFWKDRFGDETTSSSTGTEPSDSEQVISATDGQTPTVPEAEPYSVEDALKGLFVPRAEFVSLLADWGRKKNAILQGPPGVGKTFIAKRLAYALMEVKAPSRVEMVQFHQSYAYEDFVQGWRPTEDGGFYLKHGIFYNFCRRAAADTARRYVFIIDEINRGNLSRILGELMFLIEPDHRGEAFAIPLTYSKNADERFCVPDNVYILGMMNTADRSLSMVDYALRRRFCFTQLQPAYSTPEFKQFLSDRVSPSLIDRIVDRMMVLNGRISKDKNLGRGFEIGHSFFCPIDGEVSLDDAWYEAVIKREIAPLVREYWFDDLENAERLIADLLK